MTSAPDYPISDVDVDECPHEQVTHHDADPGVGIPHDWTECDECGQVAAA